MIDGYTNFFKNYQTILAGELTNTFGNKADTNETKSPLNFFNSQFAPIMPNNALIPNCFESIRPTSISENTTVTATQNKSIDPTHIPIGDGKVITTGPQRGFIYKEQTLPQGQGGGAFKDGPWINGDGTWDSTKKATVEGQVAWPGVFSVTRTGDKREIITNNLPNETTGNFPINPESEAGKFDDNPNTIQSQKFKITLPANPKPAAKPTALGEGPVGFLTDGSVLFDGLDATGRDAVAHEVQDEHQGHPEITGSYHHHNVPNHLWEKDDPTKPSTKVVGWALDGYPITGPRGQNGKIMTNQDLDEFHGTTSAVEIDGKLENTYHYVVTQEYPYTIGAFKGTPSKVEGYQPPPLPPGGNPPPKGAQPQNNPATKNTTVPHQHTH
jgi:YHYH protein